jgi:hypothetical protein
MSDHPTPSETDLHDVAALADGSLDLSRREEVEARIAANPELTAELARQRRSIELVVQAQRTVQAPPALRQRVAAERARRRPLVSFGRWGLAAGVAGIAAAVLALFLVLPSGISGDKLIAQATAAQTRPVERPAPQEASATLLAFERFGVTFPAYRTKFKWDAVGERADRAEGREIATVFYRKADAAIGYSVISGDTIDPPANSRALQQEGTTVNVLRDGERTVVVFTRQGRTCVVSGTGVAEADLIELAAWKGKGTVPFA